MSWADEQAWIGTEDMLLNESEPINPEELIKQGYWVQNDWEPIRLSDMTYRHLTNCINMIENGRLDRKWALPYLKAEQQKRLHK